MNDFANAADLMKGGQTALSPFEAAAEELKRRQAGQVGMVLAYDERDPDEAARNAAIGRDLGVPSLLVDAEPEAYDLRLRMQKAAETLRNAPKTAAWLSDMGNGVLAKDDLDNLSWFERGLHGFADLGEATALSRAISRGVQRTKAIRPQISAMSSTGIAADIGRTVDDLYAEELQRIGPAPYAPVQEAIAREAAQARFDMASQFTAEDRDRFVREGAAQLARAAEVMSQVADTAMSPQATTFRDKTLAEAPNTLLGVLGAFAKDPVGGTFFVGETAAEFIPALIASSAVTAATRNPAVGAIFMGGASAMTENTSSAMDFLAEQGVSLATPEEAMAVIQNADLMRAAQERGLTRGVIIGVMDAISGGVAGKTLAKSPIGDVILQGIAQVGFGAGGEALAQVGAGQQVSWRDIVIEGLAELATAPIEVLGVGGRRLLRNSVEAVKAGDTASALSDVDLQAMASKLRARSPDKFMAALEAQGLGDKAVYVPADALKEYFQAKDVALDEETMRAWGIDPMTFEEAAQSGNDVAIPMANYATHIAGTEAAAWIAENATSDPEEMSIAAVKAFNASVQDIMQEAYDQAERARLADEELRASDVQIYDQMFSQLRAAGRSPDVAQNEARIWSAFWRTMGERYGEDPLDLARSMGVQVRGPQSPEFRRRDALDIALNTLRTKGERALKPSGMSLAEFVKSKGGIQDVGGDVAAMEPPKGVVAETSGEIRARQSQPTLDAMPATGKGLSLEDMGRMAAEAGYFPDLMGEVNAGTNKGEATDFAARLLAALGEDVAGRKVYAEGEGPDADLQALSDALSERGIDLAAMSNDEIAAALEATDGQTYNQDGTLKTDTPEFRAWFGDSKVVDENGEPLVVYHGTRTGGFDRFNVEGRGKTSGTGAFFTESIRGASTYSGRKDVIVPMDAASVVDDPETYGFDVVKDGTEWIATAPDGSDWASQDKEQAITEAANNYISHLADVEGNYAVYLSLQNPLIVDAEGANWNGIGGSNDYFVQNQDGEVVEYFSNEEDAEFFATLNEDELGPLEVIAERNNDDAASTDDIVRQAREDGFDGVIFENITDEGPFGQGYGWDSKIYVAFRPTQIKSTSNRGTFDPADPRILYQPAYHGSPHIFDRFSLDKIGTGEGAQAYGWGLYFAGRKGVAEYYRKKLSHNQETLDVRIKGKTFQELSWLKRAKVPEDWFNTWVGENIASGHEDGAIEAAERLADRADSQGFKAKASAARNLANIIRRGQIVATRKKPGRLYKVDIPEDSDLLAWDAPLSEQPEKVRDVFSVSFPEFSVDATAKSEWVERPETEIERRSWMDQYGWQIVDHGRFFAVISPASKSTGGNSVAEKKTLREAQQTANAARAHFASSLTAKDAYYVLSSRLGGDVAASEALRAAGIPGHRYLDGGSRADGDGSYNYVIYDDAAVSVLEFEQDKRGSILLPSGGLGNGQTVINLFQSADLSTFLHESGHFFLEAFNALASDASAPQTMKNDMAAILDWFGVKDWSEVGVKHHEQWARGFEAYAMEGKAPSLALADAFSRFKAWLTRIYRSLAGLNVKITPEIREVMDRMLATDAEIAEARAEMEMRPLFASAPPGMSEGDFATYQRMARRATETAEQALLEKTMAKVRREKEAWYREEKQATRAEVATEYDRRREYRLIDMLANQLWHGLDENGEARTVPDVQIDRKMLVDQFGDGVLAEISRNRLGGKRAIYGDNGSSPEEVAQFFGFASASEMISVLQNTPKKRDAVAMETERRMTERHGDPLNDGSIEEEALAAIHNEQQANTAVAEARHMARQLGRPVNGMTAKLYRQRARAMIGRMSVRDAIRVERFLASERKAARAAQDAFAKVARGTKAEAALAEALQAKEQQILNGFLYDEARQIAAEVQRGREKMRAYDKKSVREKLEGGYIEQIDAILADYDFRVRSQLQIARAESLKAFVDRMIEEGREGDLHIDMRLMDEANRKHYTRLSVDELRGLFDTIDNIDHLGRFKQKLIDRKRRRDLAESASRVAGQVRENIGAGKAGEKSRIAAAFNLLWRTDTLLARMDGGQEIGPAYDEIKRGIDEAVSEEQAMHVDMAKRLDGLFRDHYSAADLRKMKVERDIPGGNGRAWSKMEILAVALNTGNEDNFARLTANDAAVRNRLTREHVDALLATLDENDWRFVQGMWDMVNSYWPGLAEVAKRRTGVTPKKVEAKLMVNAPAFVTGGYFPIKYDPELSAAAATDEASGWDKFTATGRGATAAVRNGMTMQRQKTGNGRTLRLDMSVAFAHMRDTIRYIALSEAVDNTYRLVSHPDVVNAFLDAGAKDQHTILRLWLKDVASGPAPSPDALNTASRILKNNFTLSRLALNFKTVALQVTGVGQSAVVIGKRNMIRGYMEYLQNPYGTAQSVIEKSAFMKERQSTFQRDIYDFMDDTQIAGPLSSGYKKAKSVLAKIGFAPIVWTQFWAVDMPTWLGAFRTGVEKYGDEAKAIHFADRMVARAQDSGLMADRAAFERGTLSESVRQSDFVRLFTTLGGYMLTKMNRAYVLSMQTKADFRSADTGAQKVAIALSAATDTALLYLTEAVLVALVFAAMSDDEDDEDVAKFLLRETGSAVVGGMPLIRDAYAGLMGYGGGGIYGSLAEAPANFIRQVAQGENDAALRRSIADMIGMVTGLPTTGPMRAIEGALDEDVPLSEAVFGRNPLGR